MIEITTFLLASYLMMAVSYTLATWLNATNITKYWYILPFDFCICLSVCWFYFPCDVGFKLYKKLNDEENKMKEKKKKNKHDRICYNCKFQLSDKCPNKEQRSHSYTCEEFKLAWYLKSD